MNTTTFFDGLKNSGIHITGEDKGLAEQVLMLLFTNARAADSDTLPDGSTDRRGWPGDSFHNDPWGSRLWLLTREKLTTDVKNRAVDYAEKALSRLVRDDLAKTVKIHGTLPRFQTLLLSIDIEKPDGSSTTVSTEMQWRAYAV